MMRVQITINLDNRKTIVDALYHGTLAQKCAWPFAIQIKKKDTLNQLTTCSGLYPSGSTGR